jgi:hypothetical protein
VTQLQQRRKGLFHRHGETVGGDHHRLFVVVTADPRRAARARAARRSPLKKIISRNGSSGQAISSSAIIGCDTTLDT